MMDGAIWATAIALIVFALAGVVYIWWVCRRHKVLPAPLLLAGVLCAVEAYNQLLLLISTASGPTFGLKVAYYVPTYAHDMLVPMWVPALWHFIRVLLTGSCPLKRSYPRCCPSMCTPGLVSSRAKGQTQCSWTSVIIGTALALVASIAQSMFFLGEKPLFGTVIFASDTSHHPGLLPVELMPIIISASFIVYAGGLIAYLSNRWLLFIAGTVCFIGNIIPGDLFMFLLSSFTEVFLFISFGVEYNWLLSNSDRDEPLLP